MKRFKTLFTGKILILVLLVFCVLAVAVSFGYKSSTTGIKNQVVKGGAQKESTPNDVVENISKVVLSVKGMSCSGCIATIKGAVSDIKGIEETLVDIGNGKVEIYYDNKRLIDVNPIVQAITDSGYPANVQKIFSPEEMRKENALAAAKAQYYIVSVGGYEIARADFDTELEVAKKRYSKTYGDNLFKNAQGESLLDNLKTQIISRLINEGIFMQEINRTGFRVDPKILEIEMNAFLKEHDNNFEKFKNTLKDVGYDPNYFRKKFETKVLIKRYLNERILADASSDFEKQSQFNAWFSNAKTLAEVVYYDKNLKRLVQQLSASKSCGGGS